MMLVHISADKVVVAIFISRHKIHFIRLITEFIYLCDVCVSVFIYWWASEYRIRCETTFLFFLIIALENIFITFLEIMHLPGHKMYL